MMHIRLAIIPMILLLLSACANIGPVDDGFKNSNESVDIGRLPTAEIIGRAIRKAAGTADPEENKKVSE